MTAILIYTTCKNRAETKKIANALVKKKIVTCANIIPEIHSVCFWDGKFLDGKESLLLCKTKAGNKAKAFNMIKKLHSYRLPFIGAIKFDEVNSAYEKWMKSVVK